MKERCLKLIHYTAPTPKKVLEKIFIAPNMALE